MGKLIEDWLSADRAARNAEEKIQRSLLGTMGGNTIGPSDQLLDAAIKMRVIAVERLVRLRDGGNWD
ncbi:MULTISPECIES: hypothetical protein [Ramlibacter]|uniref:Uncharacterized protein n=1 Tax=Ramlibacter pinisoli TaxID=2682844 RepID=A0A6N8IT52_9BURK|nr:MULTISPECIES: hypothetical protein [Ramlibacter]MVQ30109.1 hypothetical protein [Ramlibacter pinisoli]